MNEKQLRKLQIKGFKSIKEMDLELKNLNILVGANGSGKSNLLSFFKLLRAFIDGNLNFYITQHGGASDLLYNGRKNTKDIYFESRFSERGYRFYLMPTDNDVFVIRDEARYYEKGYSGWWELGSNTEGRSLLAKEAVSRKADSKYSETVYKILSSWQVYHFHDTSNTSGMRHYEIVQDNEYLREDASNIAPFLLSIKNDSPHCYKDIINAIRMVTPFFDDFILKPRKQGQKEDINLSWTQKGSDYPMQPYHFSDGTMRFICLAVALLQPKPPATIIIDEPELGLHPSAILTLAELIQSTANDTQLLIATQSPLLIDQFAVENIIVTKRENGASTFIRLNEDDLSIWLEDYSLGELLTKNVIQGGPTHE